MEKRKRGRPKGSTKKKRLSSPEASSNSSSPQAPEVLPPKEPTLVDHVKNLAGKLLPLPQPQTTIEASRSPEAPQGNQPSTVGLEGNFAAVAAETREKYSAAVESDPQQSGNGVPPGNGESAGAGGPAPQPIADHFIPPEFVEAFRVMVSEGLGSTHGTHWRMTEGELKFFVAMDVAMLDEQGPKFLSKFSNPCLVAWVGVNLAWIGTRSPELQQKLSELFQKLIGFIAGFGKKGQQ